MGRNSLRSYKGKTLEQWQQDIRNNCKDGGERRCKMTDSLETLRYKSEMNFRCLLARSAVQYFYDDVDPTHARLIQEAKAVYDNCHRLLMQSHRTEFNRIKSYFGKLQKYEEDQKRAQKGAGMTTSQSLSELQSLLKASVSDTLKNAISAETGLVDADSLKEVEKSLKQMEKEAASFNANNIKIRVR